MPNTQSRFSLRTFSVTIFFPSCLFLTPLDVDWFAHLKPSAQSQGVAQPKFSHMPRAREEVRHPPKPSKCDCAVWDRAFGLRLVVPRHFCNRCAARFGQRPDALPATLFPSSISSSWFGWFPYRDRASITSIAVAALLANWLCNDATNILFCNRYVAPSHSIQTSETAAEYTNRYEKWQVVHTGFAVLLCNHEDLLALWVSFKAKAMQQLTSCTLSMFQSVSMLWTNGKIIPLFHRCCLSSWIVNMTTTLWERFNNLMFPDSGLCNDLELLDKGTRSQMQWYIVPLFQHQNI